MRFWSFLGAFCDFKKVDLSAWFHRNNWLFFTYFKLSVRAKVLPRVGMSLFTEASAEPDSFAQHAWVSRTPSRGSKVLCQILSAGSIFPFWLVTDKAHSTKVPPGPMSMSDHPVHDLSLQTISEQSTIDQATLSCLRTKSEKSHPTVGRNLCSTSVLVLHSKRTNLSQNIYIHHPLYYL